MSVAGIDEISFGVADIEKCRQFFLDLGLQLVQDEGQAAKQRLVFETLNGGRVVVAHSEHPALPAGIEADPTLREVVWGVDRVADLAFIRPRMCNQPGFVDEGHRLTCKDPNGLSVKVQVSVKRALSVASARTNTWSERVRINAPSPAYDRATPVEVGHVVFFVKDLQASTDFYQDVLGFVVSDRYPGRGHFMRCAPRGGHHDLFLLELPSPKAGLNHVAFTVRDLHEVIGGGLHMSRCGWDTELGPGRHPISSALFWYFVSPAGALVEYYTDEDELTEAWQARDYTPGPTVFAEWAIKGGIDGTTRRQKDAAAPSGRFMTDKT